MFKKSAIAVISLSALLLLPTACSDDNPSGHQQAGNGKEEMSKPTNAKDSITLSEESLQKGDHGEQVRQLQLAMIEIGYPIKVTETYDEDTTWAITDLQLQHDKLDITGMYNKAVKTVVETAISDGIKMDAGKGLPRPDEIVTTDAGTEVIANPYELLALVNKHHALPVDYIPEDLVTPDIPFPFTEDLPKKQMRKPAADAIEKMFAAAAKEGLELFGQSGYRSYDRQKSIFAANVNKNGEEAANKYSARPGESEHQSGLTMDVTNAAVSFDLIIEFGETPEGKWLQEHAAEYGFIIRYPKGKEEITEYQYEPWHLRYVGKKAAMEMLEKGLTLEEYVEQL